MAKDTGRAALPSIPVFATGRLKSADRKTFAGADCAGTLGAGVANIAEEEGSGVADGGVGVCVVLGAGGAGGETEGGPRGLEEVTIAGLVAKFEGRAGTGGGVRETGCD
jgi:hypothetical protein